MQREACTRRVWQAVVSPAGSTDYTPSNGRGVSGGPGAPHACTGSRDEDVINAAVESLIARVQGEAVRVGPFRLLEGFAAGSPECEWEGLHGDEVVEVKQSPEGEASLAVRRPNGTEAGVRARGLSLDLSACEELHVTVKADVNAKIRICLEDTEGRSCYYLVKIGQAGRWERLSCVLSQPYLNKEGCDLRSIAAVKIEYHIYQADVTLEFKRVAFVTPAHLGQTHIQPGSVQLRGRGGRGGGSDGGPTGAESGRETLFEPGRDYDVDYERGVLYPLPGGAIAPGSELSVDYEYGGGVVRLLPGVYNLDATSGGIALRSFVTLEMHGAVLVAAGTYTEDAALIHVKGMPLYQPASVFAQRVAVVGGEIQGFRERVPLNVNVYGVAIYNTDHVSVEGVYIHDLSGPAISVGSFVDGRRIRDVRLAKNRVERCGAAWIDVKGHYYGTPAKTQSKAAFNLFRAEHFTISDNSISEYPGDGTWVYLCAYGTMSGNTIRDGAMGAYFCEGSTHVVGVGNRMIRTGSRGVTIERGSHANIFQGNVVIESGREGIWLIGSSDCVIEGNILTLNGRRRHPEQNSAIKVDWDRGLPQHLTHNNVIAGNIITTDAGQEHAIWITSGEKCRGTMVAYNKLLGDRRDILDEGMGTTIFGNSAE